MRRTLVSAVAAAAVTASLFAATPAQAAEVDIKGSGSSFAGNFLIDCASRKIFDGTITKWNDPAIAALNPKATLPDKNFVVVYRSSNSGTTQNVQNYFQETVGGAWPAANQAWVGVKTGSGQATSADLVAKVKGTSGGIGYADLSDVGVKLGKVTLKNAKGEWVKPSVAAASKMLSKQKIAADGSIDINFTKKIAGAYQLSIATYLMIPTAGDKAPAAKAFAKYAIEKCSKKPAKGFAGFTGANYKTALKKAS